MKTLYFDCFAGISGDMTIGALLDLGVDFKALELELKKLSLTGYQLGLRRVSRSEVAASKFDVILDEHSHPHQHPHSHKHHLHQEHEDHHDHEHHHTHDHDHEHHHDEHHQHHDHEHHHSHEHNHSHDHEHSHPHQHRGLPEICQIIDNSTLSDWVKEKSKEIFYRLAVAEGKIHNIPAEKVHFHEVGAIDAIVDIVGACIGFELLGVDRFICSALHVGSGFVNCAHGRFPIPAPGTLELLKGVPTYATEIKGELVTPTGAAIVSTLCSEFVALPAMKVERVGYGAGNRDPENFPNVLRLLYGEVVNLSSTKPVELAQEILHSSKAAETITVIEANIDDMNPQIFGYLMDYLLKQGALDVFYTSIYMKKNRPATLLTVLTEESNFKKITDIIFQETTTLGIRYYQTQRQTLSRHTTEVETAFGRAEVKFASLSGKIINVMPEYESCILLAQKANISLASIQTAALTAFEQERDALQQKLNKG